MKAAAIITILLVAFAIYIAYPFFVSDGRLTLHAAPGNSAVQMFSSMTASAAVIAQLSDGTKCKRMDGPLTTSESGIAMTFYKVDCSGAVGFVNAKWVR